MALLALVVVDMAVRHRRTLPAVFPALALAVAGGVVAGLSMASALVLAATVAAEAPLWWLAHRAPRGRIVLATIGLTLMTRVLTTGLWEVRAGAPLDRWVAAAPYPLVGRAGADRVAYVVAAAVFLTTAGNTLVRLLLRSVGTMTSKAPGGGRVIGSIERVLIFALALAGEPTAATLVVSAKGILRFAEVRAADEADIDPVTEYVLVGSLASYALALAFVPLALA